MFKNKIILALFIFALVNSGAKIYAQTSDPIAARYFDNNYHLVEVGILDLSAIAKGIDSVLSTMNLMRNEVQVFGSSSISASLIQSLNAQKKTDTVAGIDLENILCYRKEDPLPGYTKDSIIISGRINFYANNKPSSKFSFQRMTKFGNPGSICTLKEDSSFWDSTAKPILVTLGAIAVIALFFLVRG